MDQKSLNYEVKNQEDGLFTLIITIPNLTEQKANNMKKGLDLAIKLSLRKTKNMVEADDVK